MIKINVANIKRVFILEDNKERQDFFAEIFKDCSYFITKNIPVARRTLNEIKYDIIFLDHDLEEPSEIEGKEDYKLLTGLDVAEILRDTINKETPCIIHSMNPTGAANMVKAHPFNTCHIPFHLLKESFIGEPSKKETK